MRPFLRFIIYRQDSAAWFYGLPDGTERIDSKVGCQQGDVMSMFFYVLKINPFPTKIHDIVEPEALTKCFPDDLAVHALLETMTQVIPLFKKKV